MLRHRPLVLLSAFATQLCLGATYAWSVFVQPLRELTGLPQSTLQLPFSVFYIAFPATMILAGTMLHRLGPRRCAALGGLLFGSGWVLASLGSVDFLFTVLGIGLLAGVGVGFAYVVPIAVLVQWFPDQKGLVTGIAVAGFGGGAALIGQLAGRALSAGAATPFSLFTVCGITFALVVVLAALVLRFPPGHAPVAPPPLPVKRVIHQPAFMMLYAAMTAGLAAGFAVNANLKELSSAASVQAGIAAVSLFAVANAAGRLTWGALCDRMQAHTVLKANLFAQAVILAASVPVLTVPNGLLLLAALTGFNYGGVLVIYATTVARLWGSDRVGQVYGLLFSANILAAPVVLVAGGVYDYTGGFTPVLYGLAFLLVLAGFAVHRTSSGILSGPLLP
jgi:OFA family oxalate/formate antiporter-like MFS transporter